MVVVRPGMIRHNVRPGACDSFLLRGRILCDFRQGAE